MGTWDSDYAFIYEFVNILERIFQMFANILSSLGGSSNSTTPEGDDAAAEQ